jgi:4-hydroxybenzoate polyprenyltransferase
MDFTAGYRAVSGGLALASLGMMLYYSWVAARAQRFGPADGGRIMMMFGLLIFFGSPAMFPRLPEEALTQIDLVGFATFALGTIINAWGRRSRARRDASEQHIQG